MSNIKIYCNYSSLDAKEFNNLRLNFLSTNFNVKVVSKNIIKGGPVLCLEGSFMFLDKMLPLLKENKALVALCFEIGDFYYSIHLLEKLKNKNYKILLLLLLVNNIFILKNVIFYKKKGIFICLKKKYGNV